MICVNVRNKKYKTKKKVEINELAPAFYEPDLSSEFHPFKISVLSWLV